MIDDTIGAALERWRRNRLLTARELCRTSGVSRGTWDRIVKGLSPSLADFIALIDALELDGRECLDLITVARDGAGRKTA